MLLKVALQVTDHVWWYTEDSSDLVELELAGFQKLSLLRGDPDGVKLYALLKHGWAVRGAAALIGDAPVITSKSNKGKKEEI